MEMKRGMKLQRRSGRSATGFFFGILFFAFAASSAFAADDPRGLFDQAIRLRASELAGPAAVTSGALSAESSHDLFAKSAELFETESLRDWRLWYEAGNARWWAGDSDKAIGNYRRYLSHDYFRGEVWENLAEARRSAQTQDPGNEGFLAWPWPLWVLSAAALVAGLAALAFSFFLFLKKASEAKRPWLHVSAVLASVALALALASGIAYAARGNVAVIAKETQGRKGDSSVYAVWPATPWKAGQEVFIAETRDTWTRIRVGKTVSWVPSDCLEKIGR
jgi:hypothetical protein